MRHILFLAQRLPYPPNKGDKIRSWHILEHLAKRYRVHLGCFIDDEADWQYADHVRSVCASTHFAALKPWPARLRCGLALAGAQPLTFAYFDDAGLRRWVRSVHEREPIDAQFAFCSSMAPFAESIANFRGRRVIDFVDVDSQKWDDYAARSPAPKKWIYRREANLLRRAEAAIASRFDRAVLVSEEEAQLFRTLHPATASKVGALRNGVDEKYFDPALPFDNPYADDAPTLVFTGMMDYWANIDAVTWFAEEVFPRLREAVRDLRFAIVGGRPSAEVQRLAQRDGVLVTGRVADVRPFVRHATLAVAPMRIARGVQNKVLEAMAMGRAVVTTPDGATGIAATDGRDLAVAAAEPAAMAKRILDLLQDSPAREAIANEGRRLIESHYTWPRQLETLCALIDGGTETKTIDRPCATETSAGAPHRRYA
jgi:sugar transferase (PEP-CTERM/EpsH1 system associated)